MDRAWLALIAGMCCGLAAGAANLAPASDIYELWVDVPRHSLLDTWTQRGILIGTVRRDQAQVHVDPGNLAYLYRLGVVRSVPRQVATHFPSYTPTPPKARPKQDVLGTYPTYEALTQSLEDYSEAYPDITRLVSLGQSVQGRELWALLITDAPDVEEDEPEFKYVSTMHGDEPVGTVLCLYLIDHLLTGYRGNERVTELVDSTAIWLVPLMNPDGYVAGERYNANFQDLNRDFPDFPLEITGTIYDGVPLRAEGREPETAHVMRWTAENSFVLSANLHTGALVVNYPYDDDDMGSVYSPTPDDGLFQELSLRYAEHNPPMYNSAQFDQGITNGAAWYSIHGGMQDWNYRYAGCMEVTIELSNTKWPEESQLPQFWMDNRESMLGFIEQAHMGVRGLVTDALTQDPLYAKVRVEGNTQPVFTDPDVGDYHRPLLPGTYALRVEAAGYLSRELGSVEVGEERAVRRNVRMLPEALDVNEDQAINALDVQAVINAGLEIGNGGDSADANGDGKVNATDIQLVINGVLAS